MTQERPDAGETVPRTEYERMRSIADGQHAKYMAALAENEVMRQVLDSLDTATRIGGLTGTTPFDVGFIWCQNREALLAGETTWVAQFGSQDYCCEEHEPSQAMTPEERAQHVCPACGASEFGRGQS